MGILGELNADGTTIMLVTHDANVAARTSRTLSMLDGRIIGDRKHGAYTGDGPRGAARTTDGVASGARDLNASVSPGMAPVRRCALPPSDAGGPRDITACQGSS